MPTQLRWSILAAMDAGLTRPEAPVSRSVGCGLAGGDLLTFERLPSTNAWVLKCGASLKHGDTVRAIRQSAGRGRFDRTWSAPEDRSLALTVCLRSGQTSDWTRSCCGFMAALAVRATLGGVGLHARTKWPNDVQVGGRKIAGILSELSSDGEWIAMGIGLNVNLSSSDIEKEGLTQTATSMLAESGKEFTVAIVCESLLRNLNRTWLRFTTGDAEALWRSWRRHDALLEQTITVHSPTGPVSGIYKGVDADGRLVLQSGKEELRFWSGDVSLSPEHTPWVES